jgi:tight adherence protein B
MARLAWWTAVGLVALAGWLVVPSAADARTQFVGSRQRRRRVTRAALRESMRMLVGRVGIGPASRRQRAGERVRAIQALGALAAELEVGQPPRDALRRAAGTPPVWPVTLAALQMDGDVLSALAEDARRAPLLRQLAACWQVGAESGAGLAASVGRLAATARSAEDVRVDLEGQLAGPRATARMLAVLPLVGIAFGAMLGSDPLAWLLTSAPGRLCLLAGVTLTGAGTWWTGRIAARVERLL